MFQTAILLHKAAAARAMLQSFIKLLQMQCFFQLLHRPFNASYSCSFCCYYNASLFHTAAKAVSMLECPIDWTQVISTCCVCVGHLFYCSMLAISDHTKGHLTPIQVYYLLKVRMAFLGMLRDNISLHYSYINIIVQGGL